MEPPAPGLFSITTDWPSASPSTCVIWRASVSVAPPGGNATTSRIGRSGYDEGAWASAGALSMASAIEHHRTRLSMMPSLA